MGALGRLAFRIISTLVAIPIGKAVARGTAQIWTRTRPENPPTDPKLVRTDWRDAVLWALLTGLGSAVAQLVTTRGADTVWRVATGHPSPEPKIKPTKAEKAAAKDEKKLAKAQKKAEKVQAKAA